MLKKFFAALIAALFAISLAGCSSPQENTWVSELNKSGFSDPILTKDGTRTSVLMATLGTCRIRFVVQQQEQRLYATVPGSPSTEKSDFVGDPTADLLKKHPGFAHCFNSSSQS